MIGILTLIAEHQEMTLTEVVRASGLSEATVFRYLGALVGHGWLVRHPSGSYSLGIAAFHVGQRAVANLDVRRLARPVMEDLREEYGETVNLAVRQADAIIVVDCLESPSQIRRGASIGEQDQWFSSGLGKSILACLSEPDILRLYGEHELVALTERTLTTLPELLADIRKVRTRGYSVDNEESEIGLMCVASAIHDRHGEPRYAVSVSGPAERIRLALKRGLGDGVVKAARIVSEGLGWCHF
ncbi:MAG: IclR family transcriptional regulator [Actinomycetota bacterium]|nr:IclR family transcriptional regulator [Actinomycetota bacterium]